MMTMNACRTPERPKKRSRCPAHNVNMRHPQRRRLGRRDDLVVPLEHTHGMFAEFKARLGAAGCAGPAPTCRPVIIAFMDTIWSSKKLQILLMTLPAGTPVTIVGTHDTVPFSFSSDGTLDVDVVVQSVMQAVCAHNMRSSGCGLRSLKLLAKAAFTLVNPVIIMVFPDKFIFNKSSLIQFWWDTMEFLQSRTSTNILTEIPMNFRHRSMWPASDRFQYHTVFLQTLTKCMQQLHQDPSRILYAEAFLSIKGAMNPMDALPKLTQTRSPLPKELMEIVIYLADMHNTHFAEAKTLPLTLNEDLID